MTNEAVSRGNWDPGQYGRFRDERSRPYYDRAALVQPRPGMRVVDLGCGPGDLTAWLHGELQAAETIGVDSSDAMLEKAVPHASAGLTFVREDIRATPERYPEGFDLVFSNAALHWMKQPDAVIAGVRRALRPGGRFVAEMGGHGNVGAVRTALGAALARRGIDAGLHDPWYFPTVEDYRGRLQAGGFVVETISDFARPTVLPGAMVDWLETFAGAFLAAVNPNERRAVLAETAAALEPSLKNADGSWWVDYVRLRFHAVKPAGGS